MINSKPLGTKFCFNFRQIYDFVSIIKINSKIQIFHAEDDGFVPVARAFDLLKIAEAKRPKEFPKVELTVFKKELQLGHSGIHKHEDMYSIIRYGQ
jgi:hypothetical protein